MKGPKYDISKYSFDLKFSMAAIELKIHISLNIYFKLYFSGFPKTQRIGKCYIALDHPLSVAVIHIFEYV